jgi:hypothetical protein
VPETAQLSVRRLERSRVEMTEADHRDACDEVEVAVALRVDERRALAGDEGHVLP